MKPQLIRQGDVLVRQVRKRSRKGQVVEDKGRVILAYGEVTGHAHEVVAAVNDPIADLAPAQLFEEPDGRRFLFVDRPCTLTHQEHGPITLAPGCFEVIRQREYSPGEVIGQREYSPGEIRMTRMVAD